MIKHFFKQLKRSRNGVGERIVFILVFLLFALYAFSLLYVLYYALMNSFKMPREYLDNPTAFPNKWLFKNYINAFKELSVEGTGFVSMTINSLWWAGGHVVCHLLVVTLFSYVMSKYKFKLRPFLWGLNLFIIMIPIYGTMSATYALYNRYHMLDSPLMLLAATGGFGSTTLILMAFFDGISWTYGEAGMIDGADHFQIFFRIMLPQAFPCVAAIGLVQFIATWNDYMGPLLYLDSHPTLASGLYLYHSYAAGRMGNYPIYFAGLIISLIPVLTLYTCFSDTIMKNMGIGGLK